MVRLWIVLYTTLAEVRGEWMKSGSSDGFILSFEFFLPQFFVKLLIFMYMFVI